MVRANMIDYPSPFAPKAEWDRFLEEIKSADLTDTEKVETERLAKEAKETRQDNSALTDLPHAGSRHIGLRVDELNGAVTMRRTETG